jgi:hypothetical protein
LQVAQLPPLHDPQPPLAPLMARLSPLPPRLMAENSEMARDVSELPH